MNIKKGDLLEFEIEKYAFEGKGIAKVSRDIFFPGQENDEEKKYVVFVEGSYPGDKVKAKLLKIKKTFAESKAVEIISPSPERVNAECNYFGTCGGCKQQDLKYSSQTKYKQQQVEEIFTRMGGLKDFEIEPILPSDIIFHYRNKMEYSFSDKRWLTIDEIKSGEVVDRNFALGLHIPGMFDKVLDIKKCYLQSPVSSKILNLTRDFFKTRGVSIYSTKTHDGYLRNLVIKCSHNADDLMVNLVTSSEDDELMKEYSSYLLKDVPEIKTIVNNINIKKAAVAAGDYEKVFYGSGFIYDYIGNYKFRISANSFFQTNTFQAEHLYDTALNYAGLKGEEIVYDLYSGAGTISIYISGKAKKVFALGLFIFSAVYFSFGIIKNPIFIWFIFPIYGIYIAFTDGVSKAYLSEFIDKKESGSYFGLHQTLIAVGAFLASAIGGILWNKINPSATFYYGSLMAALALLIFLFSHRFQSKSLLEINK